MVLPLGVSLAAALLGQPLLGQARAATNDTFWPDGSGRIESYAELLQRGVVIGRTGGVLVHADEAGPIAALPEVADAVRLRGGALRVTPASGVDDLALARTLHGMPGVSWAVPDLVLSPKLTSIPNDPLLVDEWHLENTGQGGRTVGSDINAEVAWEFATGLGQQIAILDSGVQLVHPDLSVIAGHDYLDNDDDPDPDDSSSGPHGTCVSGVAAGVGDNAYGVAGVAWNADVYAVRIIGEASSLQTLYDAFIESVDAGSGVLSNSWGWSDGCAQISNYGTFDDMFDYAENIGRGGLGSVVVFAAGNGGCDIEGDQMLAHRKLIVVAAVEGNDVRAGYSNFGDSVDIAAPTTLLTTDMIGGGYGSYNGDDGMVDGFNGTSASTPVVSGVVALMIEANPRITAGEIRNAICATATRIDIANAGYNSEGWSPYYGCGRIDAGAAVAAVADTEPAAPAPIAGTLFEGRISVAWESAVDPDGDVSGYEVEWWLDDAVDPTSVALPGNVLIIEDPVAAGQTLSWRVRAIDPWGAGAWSETVAVLVEGPAEVEEVPVTEEPSGCATSPLHTGGRGALVLAATAALSLLRRRRGSDPSRGRAPAA